MSLGVGEVRSTALYSETRAALHSRALAVAGFTTHKLEDTLPGGPAERTVEYKAPFFLPDREEDYRVAWEVFANE